MWGNSEPFSVWANRTHAQLIARQAADVPCGSCTACCRAGQFIHVGADEPARRAIPDDLLVPAPGTDHEFLMGHDEQGYCPMLIEDRCSIYADRPQACRAYDCRIFSAADVYPDSTQQEIAARARQWSFQGDAKQASAEQSDHQAVKNAARYLLAHADEIFGAPVNEIQISLSALKVRALFASTSRTAFDPALQSNALMTEVKALLQP